VAHPDSPATRRERGRGKSYLTTVEKSSSVRIMSEASLVTSLPLMPIEMPTSAAEIAGESFTPSLRSRMVDEQVSSNFE
jgi:hypothetical protein